jgi:heat shock protein HslJ
MSNAEQESHTWVVASIGGVPTVEPRPRLSLSEDGLLTGTTGVNRIVGTYKAENELVKVEGTGMTRMAGPPEAMDQEKRFLRSLEGWQAFHVGGGRLEIGPVDAGIVCVLADSEPPTP